MLPDSEFMEFMEEQTELINTEADLFRDRYGFGHECRCDLDFKEGNVGMAPACWVGMVDDAMDALVMHRNALRAIASGVVDDPVALAEEFFTS